MSKSLNLEGLKFNKLLVITRIGSDKNGQSIFKCQCDCGNVKNVLGNCLKFNLVKSCGCLTTRNIINEKFGLLTVLNKVESERIENQSFYLCKCECGKEKQIKKKHLIGGNTKSCGCLRFKKEETDFNFKELILANAMSTFRHAYNDGNLSFKDFLDLSGQNCYYCDGKPNNITNVHKNKKNAKNKKHLYNKANFIYNGLDRIDSDKDHSLENVVPCCKHCNYAKRTRSSNEFKEWIVNVYNKFILSK